MKHRLSKEEREARDVAMFRDVLSGMTKAAAARKHGVHRSMADQCYRTGGRILENAIPVSDAMANAAGGIPLIFTEVPKYKGWRTFEIDQIKDKYGLTYRERLEQVYRYMEHQRRVDAGEYKVSQASPPDDVMQTCETV